MGPKSENRPEQHNGDHGQYIRVCVTRSCPNHACYGKSRQPDEMLVLQEENPTGDKDDEHRERERFTRADEQEQKRSRQ